MLHLKKKKKNPPIAPVVGLFGWARRAEQRTLQRNEYSLACFNTCEMGKTEERKGKEVLL